VLVTAIHAFVQRKRRALAGGAKTWMAGTSLDKPGHDARRPG